MFAHICFDIIEKQSLSNKIFCLFNKPIFIKKIPIVSLNSFYIELKIGLVQNESYKKTFKKIKEASKQIKAYNVKGILIDKNCQYKNELTQLGFEIFNPEKFFNKNIIKIIEFLSILENKSKKQTICVLNDTYLKNVDFEFLSKIINICHTIAIISQEYQSANELIDQLYEKKGIPIVLLQDFEMLKKADYIISFSDTPELLNNIKIRGSYIIAADLLFNAKNFYNYNIITGFLFKPSNKIKINVPARISQMEFLGAIDQYLSSDLILNLEISNIITNKSSAT